MLERKPKLSLHMHQKSKIKNRRKDESLSPFRLSATQNKADAHVSILYSGTTFTKKTLISHINSKTPGVAEENYFPLAQPLSLFLDSRTDRRVEEFLPSFSFRFRFTHALVSASWFLLTEYCFSLESGNLIYCCFGLSLSPCLSPQ